LGCLFYEDVEKGTEDSRNTEEEEEEEEEEEDIELDNGEKSAEKVCASRLSDLVCFPCIFI